MGYLAIGEECKPGFLLSGPYACSKCVSFFFSPYPFCLHRWQKIFKSRLVELVVTYGNTFFVVLIVILVLLVIGERAVAEGSYLI